MGTLKLVCIYQKQPGTGDFCACKQHSNTGENTSLEIDHALESSQQPMKLNP